MTREEWKQAYKDRAPVVHVCLNHVTWVPASPEVHEADDPLPPPFPPGTVMARPMGVLVLPYSRTEYHVSGEPHTFGLHELRRLTAEEVLTGEVEDPWRRT